MEELKPRKDRYNPDNVYRIRINIGNHPGVKWVSFKDKATGEVTKGVFIPDVEKGCVRVRKGRVLLDINAIPVQGLLNTHVLLPDGGNGADFGLGVTYKKFAAYEKSVIGNMYVIGEVLNEDQKKIILKYAKRRQFFKIGRYKKG